MALHEFGPPFPAGALMLSVKTARVAPFMSIGLNVPGGLLLLVVFATCFPLASMAE